jgi:hypothetical protein
MPMSKSKNSTYLSRKLLNYGLDIDNEELIQLKSELITSRFKIKNTLQLDIHLALAGYLCKNPIIYKHIIGEKETMTYYMFLLDLV